MKPKPTAKSLPTKKFKLVSESYPIATSKYDLTCSSISGALINFCFIKFSKKWTIWAFGSRDPILGTPDPGGGSTQPKHRY